MRFKLASDAHNGLFCKTHTPGVNLTLMKCLLSQLFVAVFAQLFFLSNEAIAGPSYKPPSSLDTSRINWVLFPIIEDAFKFPSLVCLVLGKGWEAEIEEVLVSDVR